MIMQHVVFNVFAKDWKDVDAIFQNREGEYKIVHYGVKQGGLTLYTIHMIKEVNAEYQKFVEAYGPVETTTR